MTIPLKDMSNEELDLTLGLLMGWKQSTVYGNVPVFVEDDGVVVIRRVVTWKPTTNLEHSKQVQAKAIEADAVEYVVNLSAVKSGVKDYRQLGPVHVAELLNASPREIAEAAYLTLKELAK